jgi:hypothetical protein
LRNGGGWSKLVTVASWLPQEIAARPLDELELWRPELVAAALGKDPGWGSLSYIVVDELAQGVTGLVVSPWPRVDERGRLHFGEEDDSEHVTVDEEALAAVLARRRDPVVKETLDEAARDKLRRRKLAIGDVFAARVAKRFGRPEADPAKWIRSRRVLDITAIARSVAKGQTAAALVGVVREG